jgi:hypothetical protein
MPPAANGHGVGRLLMGHRKLVDQSLQAERFFERVEVFALDVLDQAMASAASSGISRIRVTLRSSRPSAPLASAARRQ